MPTAPTWVPQELPLAFKRHIDKDHAPILGATHLQCLLLAALLPQGETLEDHPCSIAPPDIDLTLLWIKIQFLGASLVIVVGLVPQLCLTLWDPMDCSLPGSSIHGTSWARILEWVAISFSRGSFLHRDWTHISCVGMRILYHWATREAHTLG